MRELISRESRRIQFCQQTRLRLIRPVRPYKPSSCHASESRVEPVTKYLMSKTVAMSDRLFAPFDTMVSMGVYVVSTLFDHGVQRCHNKVPSSACAYRILAATVLVFALKTASDDHS